MARGTNYFGVTAIAFSLLLIFFLYWLFFLGSQNAALTEEATVWKVAYIAMGLLVYLWIQAAAALSNPPGQLTLVAFLDITVSLVPAVVCWIAAFSVAEGAVLSELKQIVVALVTLTAALDLLFFVVIIGGAQMMSSSRRRSASQAK